MVRDRFHERANTPVALGRLPVTIACRPKPKEIELPNFQGSADASRGEAERVEPPSVAAPEGRSTAWKIRAKDQPVGIGKMPSGFPDYAPGPAKVRTSASPASLSPRAAEAGERLRRWRFFAERRAG